VSGGSGEAKAKTIFDDLLNLEINVIIKPGMTARKMPEPWGALANIAEGYEDLLCEFASLVEPVWEERGRRPPIRVLSAEDALARGAGRSKHSRVGDDGLLEEIHTGSVVGSTGKTAGYDTFDRLRVWALEAAAVARVVAAVADWPSREVLAGRDVLLKRIYRNCDHLLEILRDVPHEDEARTMVKRDADYRPDQLLNLRKIWEVGIETVVMQTVVQLDGDIITRIQEGRTAASNKAIHDLHRDAVESAIRNWQFFGQTVAQFLTSALRRFL
jgi:hypothetical protein